MVIQRLSCTMTACPIQMSRWLVCRTRSPCWWNKHRHTNAPCLIIITPRPPHARLAKQAQSEAVSLADSFQVQQTSEHPFSPREHQVLTLAADGLTNKEIAYRLGISERTVQFHINSIFNKTTTNSRTEAVALALRSGWINVAASRS